MSTAQILLLGALAGFTIFIGLPIGRLQRHQPGRQGVPQRHRDGDPALPPLGRPRRGDRARRGRAERDGPDGRFFGLAALASPSASRVGLLQPRLLRQLDEGARGGRRCSAPAPPRRPSSSSSHSSACRRRAGSRSSSRPGSGCTTSPRASRSASRRRTDEISLALVLVIGFGLHNATEGFGIVAPLSGDAEPPSWRFLGAAGPDRRRPDVLRDAHRPGVGQRGGVGAFLALAAGSILYVVIELLNVCRRFSTRARHAWGSCSGSSLGFAHRLRARRRRRLTARALDASARRCALRLRLPARHRARARAREFTYEVPGRREQGCGRLGAVRALDARGAWSSRSWSAARGRASAAGREGASTSCRRRWSTSRSGSRTTTARRRRGRWSWSRPLAPGAAEGAGAAGERQSLEGEAAPRALSDAQEQARRADRRRARRRRRPLPPLRRHRERQDRGLPAGLRRRARARARRDRARAGDRARRRRPSAASEPGSATRSRSCTRG